MLFLCICKAYVHVLPAVTMLGKKLNSLFTANLDMETNEDVMITDRKIKPQKTKTKTFLQREKLSEN